MNESWRQWEGQTVDGKFRLAECLGGSDHSVVYATELTDGEAQRVVIKLIPAHPTHAETQMNRWRQAAELSHPHLIRIFGMGRCWLEGVDLLYVVMERADEDLAEILPQRALTPDEVQAMLPPALDALAYLHGKSLVHGHLKPSNILAVDDHLKVSSDGICSTGKLRTDDLPLSIYDAPDTAGRGQTPSGDIWSLGITLVEALMQRPPAWERNRPGELVVPANMPGPFFEIARRCLRRDPQVRWTIADVTARFAPANVEREADRNTVRVEPNPIAFAVQPTRAETIQQASPPAERPQREEQRRSPRWGYIIPAAAAVVAAIALFAGPKLLKQHADAQPSATASIANAASEPASESSPSALATSATSSEAPKAPGPAEPRTEMASAAPEDASSDPRSPSIPPAAMVPTGSANAAAMIPGEVSHRVEPTVPHRASETIRGTVRVAVKVRVDRSGCVMAEKLDAAGPSRYFANIAMKTARLWSFTPAVVNGKGTPSEWILRFEFRQSGAEVTPRLVTP